MLHRHIQQRPPYLGTWDVRDYFATHHTKRGTGMVKTRTATEAKATRITQGVSIRALDLFAGCGGLSLGFQGAGYEMVGGADIDPIASRTYARNFHRYLPERELQRMGRPRDITKISSSELLVDF